MSSNEQLLLQALRMLIMHSRLLSTFCPDQKRQDFLESIADAEAVAKKFSTME